MESQKSTQSTLADLTTHAVTFEDDTPTEQIKSEFDKRPELPGVILLHQGRLQGCVSRDSLFRHLSGPFCRELFLRKPIWEFLDTWHSNILRLEAECSIHQAAELALARSLLISVRDEGPGIPADELELVFDKFVQSSKTKSGGGGTGLGLAISREIVTAHHGRIWAENNAGAGCIFYCELPLVRPQPCDGDAPREQPASSQYELAGTAGGDDRSLVGP
jgi:signal transduction histidine kinase